MARYARHLILLEVGMEGQQKLKAARVLCVGTGGLGSPLALYVAAADPTITHLIDRQQFRGIAPAIQETTVRNGIPQVTPAELKRRLDAGEDILVLDVREPFEYWIANIGGTLIPLNEVPRRLDEIDRSREIVVQCKSGGRSQRAAEFLAQQGYAKVSNLAGGILAWSNDVDPSLPKY